MTLARMNRAELIKLVCDQAKTIQLLTTERDENSREYIELYTKYKLEERRRQQRVDRIVAILEGPNEEAEEPRALEPSEEHDGGTDLVGSTEGDGDVGGARHVQRDAERVDIPCGDNV